MKLEHGPLTRLQPSGQTKRWLPKPENGRINNSNHRENNSNVPYQRLPTNSDDIPIVIEEDESDHDDGLSDASINSEIIKPINDVRRKKYGQYLSPNHAEHLNNNYGSIMGSINNANNISGTTQKVQAQRKISRAVTKGGASNLTPQLFESEGWPFLADIFTTVLEMQWTALLFTFCLSYFASWLLFAAIWYGIVYFHGDLEQQNIRNATWEPCISGLTDFTTAFLFSVETQHTTGYGFYHITEQCASAVITFCAQSIFGCILEGIMVGILFVKISRAKKRSKTLMFSRTAVINHRDGQLCFMFRIADMRKSHLLDASIRASVVSKRTTAEGEEITISQEELEVGGDGEKSNKLFLFWPTTVIHKITSSSPLYRVSATDLNPDNTKFEIIVVLQGIVEATGLVAQAKSSYMPQEILWGARFKNITSSKSKSGDRIVDYANFHEVIPVPTSPLSAQQLDTLSYTIF